MRYMVIESFQVKTSKGDMVIETGQVITLQEDKAIKLIEAGKVNPIPDALTPDQREAFEERAGVLQYEGKMRKEDAERLSWCFEVCMLTPEQRVLCEQMKPCPKDKGKAAQ